MLTKAFRCSKMQMVICVSIKYCKGFYTVGIVAFTLQFIVYLYNLVVGERTLENFLYLNWSSILGYIVLVVMYLKKERSGTDLILILLGLILWGYRIWMTFSTATDKIAIAFLFCALAIVGVIFTAIGLAGDIKEDNNKNKNRKV